MITIRDCTNYSCGKVRLGEPYNRFLDCKFCWAAAHIPAVSEALGRRLLAERPVDPDTCCDHCGGNDCDECPDAVTESRPVVEPGTRRHLLYYVLPVRDGGTWELNLDQLKARMGLFNGVKVVAVAVGGGPMPMASPDAVRDYLQHTGAEVIEIPHNPGLREVAAWEPLWDRVREFTTDGDATFFAHAKGVTKPRNPGVTVHDWAAVMYETCLDFWPLAQRQLRSFPITGTFKKLGNGFNGSSSKWHYSGTFYWVRNRDFFARNWRGIDRVWWGTESYPGLMYAEHEGGAIFKTGPIAELNLYTMATWQEGLWSEYRAWLLKNSKHRSGIGCLQE